MSQAQRTYQTVTTINVSQDYKTPSKSSSPAGQTPRAGVARQNTELVEDSLNAHVNKISVADDTEVVEDSVETPAAAARVTSPANRLARPVQPEEDELYSLTPSPRKTSNNALNALLARGAFVHKPAVQKSIGTKLLASNSYGTRHNSSVYSLLTEFRRRRRAGKISRCKKCSYWIFSSQIGSEEHKI